VPTYRVRIPYREPTHAARRGLSDPERHEPFTASVDVVASSPEEAVEKALDAFEVGASESGVGWIREPVEEQIEVREIGPGEPPGPLGLVDESSA